MCMTGAQRKARQRANPAGYAKSRVVDWKQQGINEFSFVEYEARIEAQHGECPICHCPIDSRAPLDHNHQTGDARGVLCGPCNLLLGKVEGGTVDFFLNAAVYLRTWELVRS